MARPQLPEGLTVVYEYDEIGVTYSGRLLVAPHRRTKAVISDASGRIIAVGETLCREGPARDEQHRERLDGTVTHNGGYDQFSRKIGRDIALGRALKVIETGQKQLEERVALSSPQAIEQGYDDDYDPRG